MPGSDQALPLKDRASQHRRTTAGSCNRRYSQTEGTTVQKLTMALVLGLLAAPWEGRASDLLDTRLGFVFGDDNVLDNTGRSKNPSPAAHFGGTCQNALFFDNVNSRYCGFETLSHVVLYKQSEAFFPGLTTEAALALLVLEQPSGDISLKDDSSYIRLAYRPSWWSERENISLTAFPVSADRFRLGYTYRISWGGSGAFTGRAAAAGVPGVKLQITRDRWYAYAGAKTGIILNDKTPKELETQYGLLLGAGVDVLPTLRVEAGAGYFQKGLIPSLAGQGIVAPVRAMGASAEAVYHVGVPIGISVDTRLYKNDPDVLQKFFAPESYPGGLSYSVSLEASALGQSLEDPDRYARTVFQPAYAAAAQAKVKWNYLRANAIGLYRSLSYIQFDVPGFPPFTDYPDGTVITPELFLAVGADYHLPGLHLTPGLIAGVQNPASARAPTNALCGANNPPPLCLGARSVVIRDVNNPDILPSGDNVLPIWSVKGTLKWDISDSVAAIGEAWYSFDPDKVTFRQSLTGIAISEPTYLSPQVIGFNTIVQCRF